MKTWKIKKGNHYSEPRRIGLFVNELSRQVYIDPSWIHTEVNPGWNKLMGLSDWPHHHKHSNRIGWRCIDGKIVFAHYLYLNGKRVVHPFAEKFATGQWLDVYTGNVDGVYLAKVGDEESCFERTGRYSFYTLQPYFGGRSTASHKMVFSFI